jgi:hypothetical protein
VRRHRPAVGHRLAGQEQVAGAVHRQAGAAGGVALADAELLGGVEQVLRPLEADLVLQRHRNYYFVLIAKLRPLARPELSLAQARELYGRLLACWVAEQEANLLLGDFSQWHYRHGVIMGQLNEVCTVDAREVLRDRVSAVGLASDRELGNLADQAQATKDFCQQSKDRIATADVEVRWQQQQGVTPREYLRVLQETSEEGMVLIPAQG